MGQTKKVIVLVSAVLSVLVLLGVVTVSPVIVDTVVSCATYPFMVMQNSIVTPLQKAAQRRKDMQELQQILEVTLQENENLIAENIALQAMHVQATQTKDLTEFASRYVTENMLLAQIILKQFSSADHFCIVNAGKNRGVTQDMIAVYNNCLVGRVVEVHPWYSKVLLVTDSKCKVPALCAATKAPGIHEGQNSLTTTKLEFVSHLQPLSKGDLILSRGDGLIYPKGFALGKVGDFKLNHLGLTYIVDVEPMLDMNALEHCYLVAKGSEYKA